MEHQYEVTNDFYSSRIGWHPRRSCEAIWSQFMEMNIFNEDPLSHGVDLDQLVDSIIVFGVGNEG